ncbi:MAG: restriction endonuclease subunit S [Pseudoflavonifractor sp.]|nr:restriction endonuclease subunit S [Pseudoflavonifractor sp.]
MNVRLDSIFDITYGSQLDLNKCRKCEKPEGYNFVNRSSVNSGVSARILAPKGKFPFPTGSLTSAMGGSVLSTFVQQEDFFTGQNVKVLIPKTDLTLAQKLYYCACIEQNRFRFSTFGREANATFDSLLVPEVSDLPSFLDTLDVSGKFSGSVTSDSHIDLFSVKWSKFRLGDLFRIVKGKRLTQANMIEGDTPFIGASAKNNGYTNKIGNLGNHHPGGIITVSYNGSIAEAFYQPKEFVASDDVNVFYPKFNLNPYLAIFLCTIIFNEKYRFTYGRKWYLDLMENSYIWLPSYESNTKIIPNWEFMEEYIKRLPYSSNL